MTAGSLPWRPLPATSDSPLLETPVPAVVPGLVQHSAETRTEVVSFQNTILEVSHEEVVPGRAYGGCRSLYHGVGDPPQLYSQYLPPSQEGLASVLNGCPLHLQ